ncbi:hypothetical protein F5051DRAFT_403980 [Lentinula edodes]|nr:hypothetical protein F5051DRAFT_403980 [Lentinula edodes]
MPSSTQSFEILFDMTNDTGANVVLEMTPRIPGRTTKSVLLGKGRGISLVLDAGSTYQYMLLTDNIACQISVQSWSDIRFPASSALSGSGLPRGLSCKSWQYC